jgi:hypothetical protein
MLMSGSGEVPHGFCSKPQNYKNLEVVTSADGQRYNFNLTAPGHFGYADTHRNHNCKLSAMLPAKFAILVF